MVKNLVLHLVFCRLKRNYFMYLATSSSETGAWAYFCSRATPGAEMLAISSAASAWAWAWIASCLSCPSLPRAELLSVRALEASARPWRILEPVITAASWTWSVLAVAIRSRAALRLDLSLASWTSLALIVPVKVATVDWAFAFSASACRTSSTFLAAPACWARRSYLAISASARAFWAMISLLLATSAVTDAVWRRTSSSAALITSLPSATGSRSFSAVSSSRRFPFLRSCFKVSIPNAIVVSSVCFLS